MLNHAIHFFNLISNEMVHNLNVFLPRVKYQIFCEVYGASAVSFYQNSSKINSLITYMVFHPNNLCATTTHNNIFFLSYG